MPGNLQKFDVSIDNGFKKKRKKKKLFNIKVTEDTTTLYILETILLLGVLFLN